MMILMMILLEFTMIQKLNLKIPKIKRDGTKAGRLIRLHPVTVEHCYCDGTTSQLRYMIRKWVQQ